QDNGTNSYGVVHDLAWYKANHPDWILYECDRVTPCLQYDYQAVVPDFTNPEVLDYQFNAALAACGSADAISWDTFHLDNDICNPPPGNPDGGHACGVYDKNGNWVQKFAGIGSYDTVPDPQYTDALIEYLRQFRVRLHALPKPMLLIPNGGPLTILHDAAR